MTRTAPKSSNSAVRAAKTTPAPAPDATPNTVLVRSLARVLHEEDLTEIEVTSDGITVRVARAREHHGAHVIAAAPDTPPRADDPTPLRPGDPKAVPDGAVVAPMVGTTYLAPEPGAEPFVMVGRQVVRGDTLLIIEAMKTMNPVTAPRAGTVEAVLVEDGQAVEYGEPLVVMA